MLDALPVVSNMYQDFLSLLSTKRGQTENYRNCKERFATVMAKFNSKFWITSISNSINVPANTNIYSNQRISVLASSTKGSVSSDMLKSKELLDSVKYEATSGVLRKCDKLKPEGNPIKSMGGTFRRDTRKLKKKLILQELAKYKLKYQCKRCG